uniref:DUF1618 domain-containing protein n=1 Tax=Aegilops tauschii TaxID=37682 RepID=M8BL73_AEGTA
MSTDAERAAAEKAEADKKAAEDAAATTKAAASAWPTGGYNSFIPLLPFSVLAMLALYVDLSAISVVCASLTEYHVFLAFDPAVSLQYEVFLLPNETVQPDVEENMQEPRKKDIHVHVPTVEEPKDKTKQWVSREFVPGHCSPGYLYDAVTATQPSYMRRWNSAEYWHGSLYVHCWNNVIMILRNSEEVYDMVPLPGKAYEDKEYVTLTTPVRRSVFASYEKGVHYVTFEKYQLHIWILRESTDGQVEWMLTHKADLGPYGRQIDAYSYMMPKLQWEAVDSKGALVSLLEARNIEEIIYDEGDGQSNTSDDVDDDSDHDQDGVYDADDFNDTTDEVDGGNDNDEDGVYDADEFSETTEDVDGESDDDEDEVYEDGNFSETTDDIDDGGQDEEGDAHEDNDDQLKSEEVSEYSWDSDEDNFIDVDESAAHPEDYGNYRLMGLHPHKDVVLFLTPPGAVAAYHVMTSRIQYLGKKLVRDPWSFYGANIAFPYRPCYVDALPAPKPASYYGR